MNETDRLRERARLWELAFVESDAEFQQVCAVLDEWISAHEAATAAAVDDVDHEAMAMRAHAAYKSARDLLAAHHASPTVNRESGEAATQTAGRDSPEGVSGEQGKAT